jgi:acetyl-CoA C-acetyltransferase
MPEAYIVDAVRTPVGRRNGGLSKIHPADLGAHALNALMSRTGIDPAAVEDVIFGCVDTIGLAPAGWPRACRRRFPEPRSTANAARRSRRCISPPKQ